MPLKIVHINIIMARQYLPFNHKIKNIYLIIYPVKDENPLQEVFRGSDDIKNHLELLYEKNNQLLKGEYHILFVWNLDGKRMTDVWIHSLKNWSDSGPLLECLTFRGLKICEDAGIASGDSVLVLGREEELRRNSDTLEKYLNRTEYLPEFPEGMTPDEEFKG